jgi:UDP-3-O-acyl N-acetylglucosamine deacetylase
MKQTTIARTITLEGIGLHSGTACHLTFTPAPQNSGIVFIKDGQRIPALAENVVDTRRGTSLPGIAVTEHLLSAIYGAGIDNLEIVVEGDEIPAGDGSALPFLEALEQAGKVMLPAERKTLAVAARVKVSDGESSLEALPFDGLKIDFMVNFAGIGEEKFSFLLDPAAYKQQIAPARTFGYLDEVEALHRAGLALGASEKNALILGKQGFINPPRFPDEPVRHKILDLLGDLLLLGAPLSAAIVARKSGHKLNVMLAAQIRREHTHDRA